MAAIELKIVDKKDTKPAGKRYTKDGVVYLHSRTGKSTKMWCLRDRSEIKAVFDIFQRKVDEAHTAKRYTIALRNLTMFVCAISIGLRGGDFCKLVWSDIFDDNWNFRSYNNNDFVPEKTQGYHKHISLYWNSDFENAMQRWLLWNNENVFQQNLNGYIFPSQKGGSHIEEKAWYKIMESTRKEAGIRQKIGTHGLRKTMANQYIKNAEDPAAALVEAQQMLGHSSQIVTMNYTCLMGENIWKNKERAAFLYK